MHKIYSLQDEQIVEVPFTAKELQLVLNKKAEYAAGADDRAAAEVRKERDAKLTETDWTALTDVKMAAEMATYRQALRDITDHTNFPNLQDTDWPEAP